MGLTKQYLAYKAIDNFNVINSGRPNVNFVVYNNIEGRYVVTGGSENALIWDLRLGQKVSTLKRGKEEVSCLRSSPDLIHIAVGYTDGVVEIFNIASQSSVCTLSLHKSAVTVLRYDGVGIKLASGGLDNEIVISDVVSQSGKYRLIGHNAPVTDVHFFERFGENNILISSSKDTQIKFWNLETQTSFKTIVDNRTEVWALAFVNNFMISGCGENAMNVYRIDPKADTNKSLFGLVDGLSLDDADAISPINVTNCGAIQRVGKGRTVNLVADSNGRVFSCHGTDNIIENFYTCSQEEAQKRLSKRLKKYKMTECQTEDNTKNLNLADEIKRLPSIKINNKIKSIDILIGGGQELRVVTSLANNSVLMYSLDISGKKGVEAKLVRSISQCGHQSEVRSVSFSSDSLAICSGSGDSLKFWNRESMQCLRTVPTDYVLSTCFVPGDRYVLVGLKSGILLIIDIGTGDIIEKIPSHKSEIWSISLLPDSSGCVTGSSDTTVKIWSFELIDNNVDDSIVKPKVLSLLHKNTLKLEEAVLCVKVSPNSKFIACGLLDSTVKLFFLDSFKFYLSLYGHKLPVLCLDISYDSSIIATGSSDRNIKIWGLDFGDCHKSIFAHDDSILALQFIPKTHMIFSCGKDGKIKQWDGDSFQKIVSLPGHIGQANNLAVSPNGIYLVTCGADRTIRLFERTDEPIVLQDVQEEEREDIENKQLATGEDSSISTLPGLKLASRKTVGSEKAAESILECLEICMKYNEDVTGGQKPEIHTLMTAYNAKTPDDFFVAVINRIRASDLEECLVLLPFATVCQILEIIPNLVISRKDQAENVLKIVLFLFKIHQKPISANHTLLPVIGNIIPSLTNLTEELRNMIGMNYSSLQLLQKDIEDKNNVELFYDVFEKRKSRKKKPTKRVAVIQKV
ncbi:WDR3 family protein [Megaselia abdita]